MCVKIDSLRLTEESRLRVFETRVLRKIFGPKRGEVMEEWRRLRNEELHDVRIFLPKYYSGNKMKNNGEGGA